MLAAYATRVGGDEPLDNLEVGQREPPLPPSGWALVKMTAASLNHHDLWTLRGVSAPPSALPRTLGCDLAGTVVESGGTGAGCFEIGTRVVAHAVVTCGECDACLGPDETLCRKFAMLTEGPFEGTLAELCTVPAANLFAIPAGISDVEAACLPTTFLTAYRMLFSRAGLRGGDTILIQGAGGGLSTATERLALAAGLRVIVASRSESKLAAALGRGVHEGVLSGPGLVGEVMKRTGGEGVDVVIESVGEATWPTSLRVLRRGGAIVVAGSTTGSEPSADLRRVFWRQLRILGSTMGTRAEFASMLKMVEASGIHPVVDSTYPLAEARRAFLRLEGGDVTGKLVVTRD